MGVLVVDRAGASEALLDVTEKLADMIRPLSDTAIPVPGSDWTVGQERMSLRWNQAQATTQNTAT